MQRGVVVFLLLVAACGSEEGDATDPDPWTWSFVDPVTGETVGCPPEVSEIEISDWQYYPYPGDSCTNYRAPELIDMASFPCSQGHASFALQGAARIDAKTADGRVYARLDAVDDRHVIIEAGRGFVELTWTILDRTTQIPRTCTQSEVVDTPWLGDKDALSCLEGAPTTVVLPGQIAGTYDVEAVLRHPRERCHIIKDTQVASGVVITEGATTPVSMQFTL